MADKVILAYTSIPIDFFRKADKANSKLIALVRERYIFCISAITEYEIYAGATFGQHGFWQHFLKEIEVLSLDSDTVMQAVAINKHLKHKRKQIDIADLFIAATAVKHNIPLGTLNRKHFDRVEGLQITD